jgi:SAM-dependent methyltransferase
MSNTERKAHVVSDRESRLHKSTKIIRLIGEERFQSVATALEVGCGSGMICRVLAAAAGARLRMFAVDVADHRVEREGYTFEQIDDTTLPFPDESFDLVISNHVIEHVGDWSAQVHHIAEIKRVLKTGGIVYFAVPNKWRLIEPHYRMPLLSWFPQRVSDVLVRLTGRGAYYDCRPLSTKGVTALFNEAEVASTDCTVAALRATLAIEHKHGLLNHLVSRYLSDGLLRLTRPIVPTFVYLLQRRPS